MNGNKCILMQIDGNFGHISYENLIKCEKEIRLTD